MYSSTLWLFTSTRSTRLCECKVWRGDFGFLPASSCQMLITSDWVKEDEKSPGTLFWWHEESVKRPKSVPMYIFDFDHLLLLPAVICLKFSGYVYVCFARVTCIPSLLGSFPTAGLPNHPTLPGTLALGHSGRRSPYWICTMFISALHPAPAHLLHQTSHSSRLSTLSIMWMQAISKVDQTRTQGGVYFGNQLGHGCSQKCLFSWRGFGFSLLPAENTGWCQKSETDSWYFHQALIAMSLMLKVICSTTLNKTNDERYHWQYCNWQDVFRVEATKHWELRAV